MLMYIYCSIGYCVKLIVTDDKIYAKKLLSFYKEKVSVVFLWGDEKKKKKKEF